MKFYRFDPDTKRSITRFNSRGVGISPILKTQTPFQIGCMHFESSSVLGMHQATCPQLFLVVEGTGWVKIKGEEPHPVKPGMAVYWDTGEEHESGSENGMTAMVIEGEAFDPEAYLKSL
ncbi:cupin domain-containing protein [Falsibacillus albus]|uniref:Cupin domain-containing protein n=1 Tax=Falsibacillus albus TaxID=2478915 RepID=A0A3L7JSA4_9BACI|nr:cupin domain-containing protein [Falsibacillus albus]RLQ93747.1 cupin domain-containing protein [Falsibacillus albus]